MLRTPFSVAILAALAAAASAHNTCVCKIRPVPSNAPCPATPEALPPCYDAKQGEKCLRAKNECTLTHANIASKCSTVDRVYTVVDPATEECSLAKHNVMTNPVQTATSCNAANIATASNLRDCVFAYYQSKTQYYASSATTTAVATTAEGTTAPGSTTAPNRTTAPNPAMPASNSSAFWNDEPIEEWDVSAVTSFKSGIQGVFEDCENITEDLSKWETSQVTDFTYLFYNTKDVTANVSGWDTRNVERFIMMFYLAKNVVLDLSEWNTSSVTNLWNFCSSNKNVTLDVGTWDTSSVVDMKYAFQNANFTGDISNWNTSNVVDMRLLFENTANISTFTNGVDRWDTRKVTDFQYCFANTDASFDIHTWKTPNMLVANSMFENSEITSAPIWETASLVTAMEMFKNMKTFDPKKHNIDCWQTPHLINALYMFTGTGLNESRYPHWYENNGIMSDPPLVERCTIDPFAPTDCVLEEIDTADCPSPSDTAALPDCTASLAAGTLCEWSSGDCGNGTDANNCQVGTVGYDVFRVVSPAITCPSNAEDLPVCQSVQDGDLCAWDSQLSCGDGSPSWNNCGDADVYTLMNGHHLNMTLMEECSKVVYHVTSHDMPVGTAMIGIPDGDYDDWCPHAGNNNSAYIKFANDDEHHKVCGCTNNTGDRPPDCPSLGRSMAAQRAAANSNNGDVLYVHLEDPTSKAYPKGTTIRSVGPPAESQTKKKKKDDDDDNTVMIILIVVGSLVGVIAILLSVRKMTGNGNDMNPSTTNLLM